ncbi:MAG: DUF3784 domain-containing protein [Bacilli bacterium]|jgi:hypothetical protein|uniref:DUF3784 domain-containing protein n=1 Tax=Ureibacillus suwonensis TaxID=313007 RepID=A0ABW0R7F5_9BACL|nr:DUF3784 domain-containing protein [Ureibacillus thermosphaericus]MBO2506927.1 DUF3784 domain-containing protein [Bacilli bacterium]
MNIGTIICLLLAVVFGMISMIFALLKEKGAMLISGFNTLSKEEQANYDQKKMSIDMRNSLFLWSILLLSGALFGYFLSQYGAFLAIVIWLILFFKDVHLDPKKAFKKYRKP